jgi:hypothetical protein
MKLIESKTLGTSAASMEFTSIPQDGTDLLLLVSARTNATDGSDGAAVRVNPNGSTSSKTERLLRGSGSASTSSTDTFFNLRANPSNFTANTFGNSSVYIPNYTGSSFKTMSADAVNENNDTLAQQENRAWLWSETSAITSLTISAIGANQMVAGTTISLYKITKGSDGIVTTS